MEAIKTIFDTQRNDYHHFYLSKESYTDRYKHLILKVLEVSCVYIWVECGTSWTPLAITNAAQLINIWDNELKNMIDYVVSPVKN